jgi:hypothetical protein
LGGNPTVTSIANIDDYGKKKFKWQILITI